MVDQSLPNTGQRIVIVCCPSFPWHKGARRETVAIDPRGGFPGDDLFVCSFSAATWQRGPHFSGWPRPAIALSFSICSSVVLLFVLLPFFLKTPKKKRICVMPSCDFLASFACARDQVRARIGLTVSPACCMLVLFSVSKQLLSHVIDLHACTENEVKNNENKRLRSTIAILREDSQFSRLQLLNGSAEISLRILTAKKKKKCSLPPTFKRGGRSRKASRSFQSVAGQYSSVAGHHV